MVNQRDLGRRYEADYAGRLIEGAQQISLPFFARLIPYEMQRQRSLDAERGSAWSRAIMDRVLDLGTLDLSAMPP